MVTVVATCFTTSRTFKAAKADGFSDARQGTRFCIRMRAEEFVLLSLNIIAGVILVSVRIRILTNDASHYNFSNIETSILIFRLISLQLCGR